METYQINHTYTLHVDCIQEMHEGKKFVLFKENINGKPLRVYAFSFLSDLDEELPNTIDVVATGIDVMSGMPVFKIERDWLLKILYGDEKLPKKYSFTIVDKTITEHYQSLRVKDSYGVQHNFRMEGDDSLDNYSVGERIALMASELKMDKNGKLRLALLKPASADPIAQYILAFTTRDNVDVVEKKPIAPQTTTNRFGEESDTLEFKQSMVFDPQTHTVNVDSQVSKIMRAIASFMNHEGGTLLVGVRGNGSVNGIKNDLPHLNEGSNGFNNYSPDWDGWNRKLMDSARHYLGNFAASLIAVEKMEQGGVVYAKVNVSKSPKPIFVENKLLFRRQNNTTAPLTGDELTWFIIERLRGDALEQFIEQKYGYETEVVEDADSSVEVKEETTVSTSADITSGAIEDERNHNRWLYLRFFADGHYMGTPRTTKVEPYNDANLVCDYQLEQYQKNENQILLMIYNGSGKVNKIDFGIRTNDWYHTDRNNVIQATNANAPWVTESLTVKCVDRNDILVAFYKENGKEYCYVRDVLDIDPSQADRSKALFTGGHKMKSDKGEMIGEIMHIPGSYRNWIAPIVNKKNVELKDPKKSGTIRRLIDILNEIYPIEKR